MADDHDDDTPPDVNTPTLTVSDDDWPLPATGDIPDSDDSGKSDDPPPVVPDFSVTVQTLREAQSAILPSAEDATDSYRTLRDATNAKKGWIFQQESSGDLGQYYFWNPASQGTQVQNIQPDPDLEKQTPKMEASLDNALLSIADAIHLTGDFTAYLNIAAQAYTKADKDSFLPSN